MSAREIKLESQIKVANYKWVKEYSTKNKTIVYKELARDLVAKEIDNRTHIISIEKVDLGHGYQQITVTCDKDYRKIYTVEL